MLQKKVFAAAYANSFSIGGLLLKNIGGIDLTGRGLNKTALRIGAEMALDRDARVEAYFNQPLPRVPSTPQTPIQLACVGVDGGRVQTRDEGAGLGVHRPHWRENKNVLFSRMKSDSFACDPHPDLPPCFADRKQMKSLLSGVGDEHPASKAESAGDEEAKSPKAEWRPERVFRTCLSSLCDSDTFGRLMEVEADSRGFYRAGKKAFVCDGLPYNWTIQQRHFREFTPILDFVHAAERLYEAARALRSDPDLRWREYVRWAESCWLGKVQDVIAELQQLQPQIGFPPADCDQEDPRRKLAEAIGYFENNIARMNYPEYRRQGLPTTSAHLESFVKEINLRVKGTEKFWNDGASGEAILQIRAAALCDDERLVAFLQNRPGRPFHQNVQQSPALSIAS